MPLGDGGTPTTAMRSRMPAVDLRRSALFWVAIACAVMYAVLSTGSIGQVFGGYDGDGGYVDDTGAPTTSVPLAVNLVFHPHWWVFALIVLVALAGIRVGRLRNERGTNPLGRTAPFAIAIVALTVLAIVVTGPVFFLGTDSTALASIHLPWWVGADVTISRQP